MDMNRMKQLAGLDFIAEAAEPLHTGKNVEMKFHDANGAKVHYDYYKENGHDVEMIDDDTFVVHCSSNSEALDLKKHAIKGHERRKSNGGYSMIKLID